MTSWNQFDVGYELMKPWIGVSLFINHRHGHGDGNMHYVDVYALQHGFFGTSFLKSVFKF